MISMAMPTMVKAQHRTDNGLYGYEQFDLFAVATVGLLSECSPRFPFEAAVSIKVRADSLQGILKFPER